MRVKLGITDLSVSEFILKASTVATGMDANPNFPAPPVTIVDFQAAIDSLAAAAEAASTRDTVKVSIRNAQQEVVANMLRQLAGYVQAVSAGNKQIIQSSGFEVIEPGGPIGPLPAPENVRVIIDQDFPGQLKVEWSRVYGAKSYIVQMTTGDPTNPATVWGEAGHSPKAKFKATGLTAGTVYSFRVIPVGTEEGGVSAAVSAMAV